MSRLRREVSGPRKKQGQHDPSPLNRITVTVCSSKHRKMRTMITYFRGSLLGVVWKMTRVPSIWVRNFRNRKILWRVFQRLIPRIGISCLSHLGTRKLLNSRLVIWWCWGTKVLWKLRLYKKIFWLSFAQNWAQKVVQLFDSLMFRVLCFIFKILSKFKFMGIFLKKFQK